GGISPSGAVPVVHTSSMTFNIAPDFGYQILDVKVDGSSVGPVAAYTFNNVVANHTIDASFTLATYTLSINIVGNGAVAKSPDQPSYQFGTQVTLTATPGTGYAFTGWTGSLVSTGNPVQITMDASKSVTATFTRLVLGYERAPYIGTYTALTTGG